MDKIALTNVRVFDGERLLEPTTVVIDGDRIGDDQAGARTWDGGGGVLLPGLIDCHIHLTDDATLSALACYGVTTGLDMGTWPPELVASLRGRPGVTDVRSSGTGATHPGQHARQADGARAGPGRRSRTRRGPTSPSASPRASTTSRSSSIRPASTSSRSGRSSKPPMRTVCVPSPTPPRETRCCWRRQPASTCSPTRPLTGPWRTATCSVPAPRGQVVVPTLTMMEAIVERLARHRTRLLRRRPSHRRAVVPGGRHDPRRDRREPGSIRARIPAVRHQPAPRAAAAGRRGPVRRRCAAVSDNSRGPVLRAGRSWGHRTGQAGRPGPHRR